MKSILYLFFFLILYKAYSFEYIRTINGKRNIVTTYDISKSEKFINFTLDGTFTDNLGNYGYSESSKKPDCNEEYNHVLTCPPCKLKIKHG